VCALEHTLAALLPPNIPIQQAFSTSLHATVVILPAAAATSFQRHKILSQFGWFLPN